ncbi:MAG TPA: hypothetical protein VI981_02145 [Candidatus Paceibacterota bacterium]
MNEFTDIHPSLAALYASSYAPATTRLSSDDYFVCFPVGKESTATFTGEPREFGGFLCLTHVDLLLGSYLMLGLVPHVAMKCYRSKLERLAREVEKGSFQFPERHTLEFQNRHAVTISWDPVSHLPTELGELLYFGIPVGRLVDELLGFAGREPLFLYSDLLPPAFAVIFLERWRSLPAMLRGEVRSGSHEPALTR